MNMHRLNLTIAKNAVFGRWTSRMLGGLLLASLVLVAPGPAEARGGAAAQPPARPVARPDPRLGPTYFDQAIRWVNDGKPGIHKVSDFYADLANVKFNIEGNKHEGYMRLWLKTPKKYRVELRPGKIKTRLTTKILDDNKMWIIHPDNRLERMHGRPGGAAAIRQLTNDRKRLMDLARFLTLEGLKGPGVQLLNEGPVTGSGTFAGNWVRVRRRIANGADITFYLAYTRDARDPTGRAIIATSPGIVKVHGDPRRNEPTEYYILKDWKRGPQFRFPGRIEAYTEARPGARPQRFLLAFPTDIRINTRLPDSTFAPPVPPRR